MSTVAAPHIARVTGIAPQFLVADLDSATTYYRDMLGFSIDFVYESFYASVNRDGFAIHLKCSPPAPGDRAHRKHSGHIDAYISVIGIRQLYEEMQTRGARIHQPLQREEWGCDDFYAEDPDGYILCFSEPVPANG